MIQKNLCKPTLEMSHIKYVFSDNVCVFGHRKRILNQCDKNYF